MTIDRQKLLDDLLDKLRKSDTNNNTDMDLVFEYMEKVLASPKIGGGSRKLKQFEVRNNPDGTEFMVVWKK